MTDNKGGDEIPQKGNEWEVVALTESLYAAAPSPRNILDNNDSNISRDDDSETARELFMSGHFGLSPSVHEKFPLEPEYEEKDSGKGHFGLSPSVHQGSKSDLKQDENLDIEGLISREFPGVPLSDEKYKSMSLYSSDLDEVASSKRIDKEQDMYRGGKLGSYNSDAAAAGMPFLAGEGMSISEAIETVDDAVNMDVSNVHTSIEEDMFSEPNGLPCEAWWRRHATSFYDHAKNANPYWSIVVAAAVIGLVIIGRRWTKDKPQVIQLKAQLTSDHKGSRWIHGPMTRIKHVTLGGQHSSYIGLSSLTEG